MNRARVLTLARYALAVNLRTPYTLVGGALLVAVTLLSVYSSARAGRGWVVDSSFLFEAAALAAVFAVRSGLATHRSGGLQTFLRANFVTPAEHMAAAAVSLVGSWGLVCTGTLLLGWVLPGLDLPGAAWHATVIALRTGVLLPFVLITEAVSDIELPFFVPAVAYVGLMMTLVLTVGETQAETILAPDVTFRDFGSTLPLAARFTLVASAGFGTVVAAAWWRGR